METPPAFEFAKEVTTQLLTLSTALIGVSIAFGKDINPVVTRRKRWGLYLSWGAFLVSVIFGVLTLSSMTGVLAESESTDGKAVYNDSITSKSRLQYLFFFAGILLLIVDAIGEYGKRYSIHKTGAKDGE